MQCYFDYNVIVNIKTVYNIIICLRPGCMSVFCLHFPQYWPDSVQNWRLTGSGTFQKHPSSPTSLLAPRWSKSRLRRVRTATFGKWITRFNGSQSFLAVCVMFRGHHNVRTGRLDHNYDGYHHSADWSPTEIHKRRAFLSALNQHVSWLSYEPLSVMNQQNDDIYRNYDLDAPYEHCAGL